MGIITRNGANGGSKNVMESIQRAHDTNTLIYLDPCENFNTNSVITVAPNEQAIFIKNGEFYGILPSGRHEVKTENYPVLSKIRNLLSGGMTTFTCQVYHVSTNEQNVPWGTSTAIEIQDFCLGGGIGLPTSIRGAAEFRVRFNISEDENACMQTFMRLMGDKSTFTVNDLSVLLQAQVSQEVSDVVGNMLEEISGHGCSINAISSHLKKFAQALKPIFSVLFADYGLELVNFSFHNLSIEDTEIRRKYLDRLVGAAHAGGYNRARLQDILEIMAANNAGAIANAGAGLAVATAFKGISMADLVSKAFGNWDKKIKTPEPEGFDPNDRFDPINSPAKVDPITPSNMNNTPQPDPMESLKTMKRMLDAGLITQEKYDAKVDEIMSRL